MTSQPDSSRPYIITSVAPRGGEQRGRRRRVALIAGLATAAVLVAGGVGGTAFALGQSAGTTALADAAGTSTVVENWAPSLPDSRDYIQRYDGSSTSTAAVAATAAQTAGVVTIVSDLTYQGAQSAGTGIILTGDGLILTNNHVVEGSTAIEVTDELTGESYAATVVGTDATHDIAVLQLQDATDLTTATLADSDTNEVAVGDTVTAVGNAEGTGDLVAATGTVTALEQTITTQSEQGIEGETLNGLIQVDADIVSGDSGGPLTDATGAVVGIDTAASSGSADITGFAIPISDALDIVAQIEQGVDTEYIEIGYPGFLGVSVAQSSTGRATVGAVIAGVIEGTPAVDAGLAAGDTVTAVNGTPVTSGADFSALLGAMEPGESVELTWTTASGATQSAIVTLIAGPAA